MADPDLDPDAGIDARPAEDRAWWEEPDPVDVFSAGLELALRRLRAEIAAVRAERDGLRLEIEALRVKLAIAQEQVATRDNLADTVRELQQAVASLTMAATGERVPFRAGPSGSGPDVPAQDEPDAVETEPVAPQPAPEPVAVAPEPAPEPEPAPSPEPAREPTALERLAAMGLWPPPGDGIVAHLPVAEPEVEPEPEPEPEPAPEPSARESRLAELARLRGELRDAAPAARENVISWDRQSTRRLPALIEDVDSFGLGELDQRERRRETSRLRRSLKIAGSVAGALAVVLVLLVTVGPKVLPYQTYFVRSGSMEPTIQTGAMVVLTETNAANLDVGDIITFENPDDASVLVTHRIVDIETNEQGRVFVTQGDANASPDPWRVPVSGTGLVYAFDVPYLGYVFGFFNIWQVRIALLALAVGAFGVMLLLDRWRPRDRSR